MKRRKKEVLIPKGIDLMIDRTVTITTVLTSTIATDTSSEIVNVSYEGVLLGFDEEFYYLATEEDPNVIDTCIAKAIVCIIKEKLYFTQSSNSINMN